MKMKTRPKFFAMVSEQGSAAGETGLCVECYLDAELRIDRERSAGSDVRPNSWTDVSENEAIYCMGCRKGESRADALLS